jgi:heme/copper-type cytochrome/quinol oxidase subunit 4
MAHPGEITASVIVFVVSAIALLLTFIAFRAMRRTESRRLRFVVAAFALFAVKGVVVGTALLTEAIQHEHLEVVSAVFDLAVVALLFYPILR